MGLVRVEVAGRSTTGPVRERNEDQLGSIVVGDPASACLPPGDGPPLDAELAGRAVAVAVADGLGGHAGGDLASRAAVRILAEELAAADAPEHLPGLLRSAFERANDALLAGDLGPESRGVHYRDAQTTLTALAFTRAGAHLAHVGDCRVYRLHDGSLELLTRDHTQAMELLRMRIIRPDQVSRHPGRHLLTRSIGGDLLLRVDLRSGPISAGDAYLLCSDGAWSGLAAGEIREALEGDLGPAVERLLERSVARGGDDNASVIAVRILDLGEPAGAGDASNGRPLWRRLRRS